MPVPVQPPAQPPVTYPVSEQPITNQNRYPVEYSNSNQNGSDSASNSEATNVVSQTGKQTNVQNNFGSLNYIQYRGGVRIPSEWSFNNATSYTSGGEVITTFGVSWQPQGKSKEYAYRQLELDSIERKALMCAGLMKQGIMIDTTLTPELAFCDGFRRLPPAPRVNTQKVSQDALEAQLRIAELQLKLEAMTQRLNQLQNPPSQGKISG